MNDRCFQISEEQRTVIVAGMKKRLQDMPGLLFAYLHGSFLLAGSFRDIDLAVYLDRVPVSPLQAELALETQFGNALSGYPLDVRVLNNAPLSFRYNVIKYGEPLLVRDDDARADFEEATLSNYFDFAPFRRMYLRETIELAV